MFLTIITSRSFLWSSTSWSQGRIQNLKTTGELKKVSWKFFLGVTEFFTRVDPFSVFYNRSKLSKASKVEWLLRYSPIRISTEDNFATVCSDQSTSVNQLVHVCSGRGVRFHSHINLAGQCIKTTCGNYGFNNNPTKIWLR